MKKILIAFAALSMMTTAFAGKGLIVTQKYTGADVKGADVTVTWYVTETQCKMKMDFKDAKSSSSNFFIPDVKNGKLLTYNDAAPPAGAQRTYYPVSVQDIKPAEQTNVSRLSLSRTGETKTIAGMICEKMVIKTNRTTTEMWVTRDFKADYYKFYPFFQSSFELMGLSQEGIQGVPLESVTKDLSGQIVSSLQLVSASQSELGESDFTVPAEYKSVEETGAKH